MYRQIRDILLKIDCICTVFLWIFGLIPILMLAYMYKFAGGVSIPLVLLFVSTNSGFIYVIIFIIKRTIGRLRILYNCGCSRIVLAKNIALVFATQYIKMIVIGIIFYVGIF